MTLTAPDPDASSDHPRRATGPTVSAAVRATIQVLTEPIFTGQRYLLLTLLEEQLQDLPSIELMHLRDDVFLWMSQVRLDQAAGVHPKHNPRALHQVMMLLD